MQVAWWRVTGRRSSIIVAVVQKICIMQSHWLDATEATRTCHWKKTGQEQVGVNGVQTTRSRPSMAHQDSVWHHGITCSAGTERSLVRCKARGGDAEHQTSAAVGRHRSDLEPPLTDGRDLEQCTGESGVFKFWLVVLPCAEGPLQSVTGSGSVVTDGCHWARYE